jgi:5-methylcytosine-specific restriction endonuclease McrA
MDGFLMAPNHNRITHYIPPAHIQPIVREFVEPNPSEHFIQWLFRYRCMECKESKNLEINEIILRSRSKSAIMDWRNRVVLCRTCHEKFHHSGVTKEKVLKMQEQRKEYLKSIGRSQYL